MSDISFFSHYTPNNAILTLSGNIKPEKAYELADKWFGPIPLREFSRTQTPCRTCPDRREELTVERMFHPMHCIKSGTWVRARAMIFIPSIF